MSASKPTYYGWFFWVAAVSFLVPLVVAAKAFQQVQLTTTPTPHPDASGVDHALWDYLLKSHVENGLIDYEGLGRNHLFHTYLRQLAEADPSKLTTAADELALLCNAYNACVVDGVITHKIEGSVMDFEHDGKGFFDVAEHIVCGRTLSLNDLEHQWIRKRYKEPRVHVALVCAARSCPAIRAEAYVGKRLAAQLEDQSRRFANNPEYVAYDAEKSKLLLSPILDWYGDDWQAVGGYLPWLAKRVEDPALKAAIERAAENGAGIEFRQYDWSLNSQDTGEQGAAPAKANKPSFGSGSIPNE